MTARGSGAHDVRVVVGDRDVRMVGPRIVLREFVAADEAAVHSYASDPRVTRFMDWGPNTPEDTRLFLDRTIAERSVDDRTRFTFAAVEIASDEVVGSGSIVITNGVHRRAEIGYVFHPEYWSKGYATDVARSLVRFGFEHLRMRRIEATCDPDNGASARVLQKAGLAHEGRMRSHLSIRGADRDSLLFAIVDGD